MSEENNPDTDTNNTDSPAPDAINAQEVEQILPGEGGNDGGSSGEPEHVSPADMAKPSRDNLKWYVIHAFSGMENKVMRSIEERVERDAMQHYFGRILVPTEEVVEVKNGRKKTSERKFYPGYVLIEMEMNDDTWHFIKRIDRVTGFLGGDKKSHHPAPVSRREMTRIFERMHEGVEHPRHKVEFTVGEMVRIKEGPFVNFDGSVEEVNYEKSRLRVTVTIFGRATPVELEFGQVEKI